MQRRRRRRRDQQQDRTGPPPGLSQFIGKNSTDIPQFRNCGTVGTVELACSRSNNRLIVCSSTMSSPTRQITQSASVEAELWPPLDMLLDFIAEIDSRASHKHGTPILRNKRMPSHPHCMTPCRELHILDWKPQTMVVSQRRSKGSLYITVFGPRVWGHAHGKKEKCRDDRWPRTAGSQRRRPISLHRWICAALHGPPASADVQASHRCGNQACIAGEHLCWQSQVENYRDETFHLSTPPVLTQEGVRRYARRTS